MRDIVQSLIERREELEGAKRSAEQFYDQLESLKSWVAVKEKDINKSQIQEEVKRFQYLHLFINLRLSYSSIFFYRL